MNKIQKFAGYFLIMSAIYPGSQSQHFIAFSMFIIGIMMVVTANMEKK